MKATNQTKDMVSTERKEQVRLAQITRPSGGDEEEVNIDIINGDSKIRVGITLSDFAETLTTGRKVECRIIRWER